MALDEIEGAHKGVHEIVNRGHEVCFLTNRMGNTIAAFETYLWMSSRLFPNLVIIFNETDSFNNAPQIKAEQVKEHEFDVVIDDYPRVLEEIRKINPNTTTILFSTWDKTIELLDRLEKVNE